MVRTSVPDSSRWVAKQCRSECGVTGLVRPQRRWAFWQANSTASLLNATIDSIALKEPLLGLVHPPPGAQDFQQLWGKHDIAIFLVFALFDSNDHPFAVDIGDLQSDSLGDA